MTTHDPHSPAQWIRWWLPATTAVLAVAGLAVSTYLAIAHFTSPKLLLCSANSVVNCETVTTSAESHVLGIPVAVLGVAYFVHMAAINTPAAWRSPYPVVRWLRLAGAGVGVISVVYLVSAEVIIIGKICLWCTAVHVITVALAAVAFAGELGWGTVHATTESTHGMPASP